MAKRKGARGTDQLLTPLLNSAEIEILDQENGSSYYGIALDGIELEAFGKDDDQVVLQDESQSRTDPKRSI